MDPSVRSSALSAGLLIVQVLRIGACTTTQENSSKPSKSVSRGPSRLFRPNPTIDADRPVIVTPERREKRAAHARRPLGARAVGDADRAIALQHRRPQAAGAPRWPTTRISPDYGREWPSGMPGGRKTPNAGWTSAGRTSAGRTSARRTSAGRTSGAGEPQRGQPPRGGPQQGEPRAGQTSAGRTSGRTSRRTSRGGPRSRRTSAG